MASVRVRGMYATALSKLLVDTGFKLVEASEKIRERLGLEFEVHPCDVTVKDADSLDELLVVGFPHEAKSVYSTLLEKLAYVFNWSSQIELHAVYLGKVTDRKGSICAVDIGDAKGTLSPCKEDAGDVTIVGVKRPAVKPNETLYLTRNFRLVGRYVVLIHGDPKLTFSEHIVDHEVRARLSSVATSKLLGTGLGVHFRSSSKYATTEAIFSEIDRLLAEYSEIVSQVNKVAAPMKLREGEFIGILGLTSLAKKILDDIRRGVATTIGGHHSLKSAGLGETVDLVEHVLSKSCPNKEELATISVSEHIAKNLLKAGNLELIHIKPTGENIRLKPGKVIKVAPLGKDVTVVVKRVIEFSGIYDGLGIEKKPEDLDYVLINTTKPALSHNYYRKDKWIGSYVNVNTPPELGPGLVKYHDLLVDIVVYPSGDTKVIDVEELEKYREQNIIPELLYRYAQEAVRQIIADLSSYIFNPKGNLEK